jgi:hypothetical protein
LILPDPPYDIAKLKDVIQKLCAQLDNIASGVKDPIVRQPIVDAADNYRRMAVDFEREHAQVAATIEEKKTQAQARLKEAQDKLKEAQDKIAAGKKAPPLFEPDWTLAAKLRDEILACCLPPPPPVPATDSLAPFVLSPEPLPPPTTPAPEQSISSWQTAAGQPSSELSFQSFASWLGSPTADPGKQTTSSADEWKRWLRKPRGKAPE